MSEIIEQMIAEELAAANEKFPEFASTHEGWAVLKEEVEELQVDVTKLDRNAGYLWGSIKHNDNEDAFKTINDVRESAIRCIEEAIQVAAMCDKFKALAGPEEIIPSMVEFYKNWNKRKEEEGDKFLKMLMNPSKGTGKPITIKRWNAKIVSPDTEPCCEVIPSKYDTGSILSMGTLDDLKARASDFTDAERMEYWRNRVIERHPLSGEPHKCANCKSYNWTPVSEHAVCMNPKNQKTETKATWSCPEWEKGEKE